MNKSAFLLFLAAILLSSCIVSAQHRMQIKGKVTDTRGDPLMGANVILKNTSYGSSTEWNGSFLINLSSDKKDQAVFLEASYVGYISKSVSIILSKETTIQNFILEENVLSLKTVLVTAQRRDESLHTVPASVTAIEGDEIQNKRANQLVDLRYSVPNLNFGTGASYAYGMITSIRGIAGTGFVAGIEARTGIYVDEVYSGRTISFNQNLLDVDGVEVLRGPQGTLFGKNAISGLINVSTRKPHKRWEGSLSVEGGNFNYLSTKFILNTPIIQNELFARIAGLFSRKDGYVKNIYNNKNMNGEDVLGGRLKLRYLASDQLEILLNIDAFQNAMDPRTETISIDDSKVNPRELSHDAEEFDYLNLYSTALTLDYSFSDKSNLKSISAFRWNNNRNRFDIDISPSFLVFGDWRDTTRQFTQEIQFYTPSNESFNYILGLYYFYQNTDKRSIGFVGPEFPIDTDLADCRGIVKTNSVAGYFSSNLRLINNLTLSAGFRYTYEYKTVKFNLKNKPQPVLFIDVDNCTDTYSESTISPKIGLNFNLSPDVFLYGFMAQGFTSGGWNVYFIRTLEHIKFFPEYATSFELGLKSNWLNNRVSANLAAFHTKLKDYQVEQYFQTTEGMWEQSRTNAGKATATGFELEISILLYEKLKINGGWGFADARFDEFKNAGGEGIDYNGNRLPWAPKNKYNISIDYQQSVGDLGKILLWGEFVYQGNYFCLPDNDIDLSFVNSHELLNARIGFRFADGLYEVGIWGKNILDKIYLLDNSPVFTGTPSVWYGPPRTFGFEIYYNFLR